MKLIIKLLKPFSDIAKTNEIHLDFNGTTFAELLTELLSRYPDLKTALYTDTNQLSDEFDVFINDKPLTSPQGVNTKLKNDDVLVFFVPMSGG